ncbi:hypothetical protein IP88_04105 [alpha proteobacterium AAP81b]|nr:hypothetical protein IP88_04105 [alpha proteobacterium AAP81b]
MTFDQRETSDHRTMAAMLIGGAVGDALGAPVEFMSRAEIVRRFGPAGIGSFAPAYGRRGAITDDTQMTLFTLEGLIEAGYRYRYKGICHIPSVIHDAYKHWYLTQVEPFDAPDARDRPSGLLQHPELWSRRAPGNTCLSALSADLPLGTPASNDSKGAGGIMRVAPVGLVQVLDVFRLGCETAALTHGHPTGQIAAGAFAEWIAGIAGGADIIEAAEAVRAKLRERAAANGNKRSLRLGYSETLAAMDKAFDLPADGDPDTLAALGEGWIAEEALAIAIWVLRSEADPLAALRLSVNITGDSDTTGTLVGQVLGTRYSTDWIPAPWLDELELLETMRSLAVEAGGQLPLLSRPADADPQLPLLRSQTPGGGTLD